MRAHPTSLIATIICVANLAVAKVAAGTTTTDCRGECVWPDASACDSSCICTFSNQCAEPFAANTEQ